MFQTIGKSSIRVGDGKLCKVTLSISPNAIYIFENGNPIGTWNASTASSFKPKFDWQILSKSSSLQATITEIFVIPPLFVPNVNTPWDIAFSSVHDTPADVWQTTKQPGDPIPISFSSDGYMRAQTTSLTNWNSWVYTQATPNMPNDGILMYRMRIGASGGSETKVKIFGGYILRITNGGQNLEWDLYINSAFVKQGDSSISVGSSAWTVVMIVYSQTNYTLFENGVQKFSKPWSAPSSSTAKFDVQHLDTGTPVQVDLSHVRCLPFIKNSEALITDLQPSLLTYYPLKPNISEAIIAGTSLDLVPSGGYSPKYVSGPFGKAIDFSGGNGALRIPSFPYGRSFSSYTLSLWVKVDQYPSGQDRAGIVGCLALRADKKLEFDFLYANSKTYSQPSAMFTSAGTLPLSQWTSVVVTYAYEESRWSLFINGNLDSIVYTTSDNSSQYASTPLAGYIGANLAPSTGQLVILEGQIGDVMLFRQHVHSMIARVLANQPPAPGDLIRRKRFALPVLIPLFIILAYEVISVGVIYDILEQSPTPLPSLETVVSRIVDKVGKPARPGAQASRADCGVDDQYPIVLDIGGEGPLEDGIVTGFPDVINVNDKDKATNRPYGPIPFLVKVANWATNPGYPFVDNFADKLTMIGCPMTEKNISEFARVIKPGGTIDLWVDDFVPGGIDRLAKMLNSTVTYPIDEDRFKGNAVGGVWFKRRQIRANK